MKGFRALSKRDIRCLAILHFAFLVFVLLCVGGSCFLNLKAEELKEPWQAVSIAGVFCLGFLGSMVLGLEVVTLWVENIWSLIREREDQAQGVESGQIFVACWSIRWILGTKGQIVS